MRKFIISLLAMLALTVSASAMAYDEARQQALFLTDKMAYELNLTDDQYEAAYEVNLDYLMSVNSQDDLYGAYWSERNADLSAILLSWQYEAYLAASYFYRPLYWGGGFWHFGIYARYPHRDYLFFGRPRFYATYRGGHSWRLNGGRSWYSSRSWGARGNRVAAIGMRNQFNNGKFGRGINASTTVRQGNIGFGNNHRSTLGNVQSRAGTPRSSSRGNIGTRSQSSTRTTVNRTNSSSFKGFGARRNSTNSGSSTPSRTFSPTRSSSRPAPTTRSFSSPSRSGSSHFSGGGSHFGGGSRSGGGGSHSGGGHSGGRR